MKFNLFILLVISSFFLFSCDSATRLTKPDDQTGETAHDNDTESDQNDDSDTAGNSDTDTDTEEKDPTNDDNENPTDDNEIIHEDTDPVNDEEIIHEDTDRINDEDEDGNEDEDKEQSDTDNDNVTHENRVVQCTELPENAEWNTASLLLQTWQNGEYVPSKTGQYSEEAASSTFEYATMEEREPSLNQCPEGTGSTGGVCEYNGCGQYAYYSDFQSKNGQFIFKEDPASSCYADKNTGGGKVPCCCGKEIYKFKNGNIQATYSTLLYATSFNNYGGVETWDEWTCPQPDPCEEGFEYGENTGKCYKCSGELAFNGEEYGCLIEIGSECRFKCKDSFNWNGQSCVH